jgi:hypothetical protein
MIGAVIPLSKSLSLIAEYDPGRNQQNVGVAFFMSFRGSRRGHRTAGEKSPIDVFERESLIGWRGAEARVILAPAEVSRR